MRNENDEEMTEKELLQEACDCLASACELLFELESKEGKAAACFTDNALRYCSAIFKKEDPRFYEVNNQKEELIHDNHCTQSTYD